MISHTMNDIWKIIMFTVSNVCLFHCGLFVLAIVDWPFKSFCFAHTWWYYTFSLRSGVIPLWYDLFYLGWMSMHGTGVTVTPNPLTSPPLSGVFLLLHCMKTITTMAILPSLSHWGRDKMGTILLTTFFRMYFLEWKCMNFDWDFTEICSYGSM